LGEQQIILGIDPGTIVMGYGLIAINSKPGFTKKGDITLIEMGVLQLSKYEDHGERLKHIYQKTESLIKLHQPGAVAIEAPFFGKNVQSMLKLGRAQGVAIAAALMHGLTANEYAPRKIKQSVTGMGNATKEQVWQMLQQILHLEEQDVRFMDATDAVAVALCHSYQLNNPVTAATQGPKNVKKTVKKTASWDAFIQSNPEKIKLK
jgi:crossover junction endodeoxyribonuclease RuvC